MPLTVVVGAPVSFHILGHSAVNGAMFPVGTKFTLTSNDPTVATVDPIPDATSDIPGVDGPVNVLASGSTDIVGDATTPDGSVFHYADTLIVTPAVPGLTHADLTLTSP